MTIRVIYAAAAVQLPLSTEPYDCWRTFDGDVACEFHRTPKGYLVRFPALADFVIDLAANEVTCLPVPDVSEAFLGDIYFNQILPLMMTRSGDLVLHASGVGIDGQAIGFIGATGRGKSTLAASLAKAGYPFLTDDGLILDPAGSGYAVRPRRPILRLRADSEAMLYGRTLAGELDPDALKERVPARPDLPFLEVPTPLAALYFLVEPRGVDGPQITRMPAADTLAELIAHSFILDIGEKPRLRAHFNRLAQVANAVTCYALDFPRRYDALSGVIEAIRRHRTNGNNDL